MATDSRKEEKSEYSRIADVIDAIDALEDGEMLKIRITSEGEKNEQRKQNA